MRTDQNKRVFHWPSFLGAPSIVLLFLACSTRAPIILDTVGPPSTGGPSSPLEFTGTGFLKVYSATEAREVGKFITYYPHTPYVIFSTNGAVVRSVLNSVATTDENPSSVSLPAGRYTVRAQDDDYGRVVVPVLVKSGQTTTVFLETRAPHRSEVPSTTNCVRMPDGRVVGWRASPL